MAELVLYLAEDVTAAVLKAAEEVEEWYADAAIDWGDFWDRLDSLGYFVTNMTSPAARKIQRHIRTLRKVG